MGPKILPLPTGLDAGVRRRRASGTVQRMPTSCTVASSNINDLAIPQLDWSSALLDVVLAGVRRPAPRRHPTEPWFWMARCPNPSLFLLPCVAKDQAYHANRCQAH